MRHPTNSNGIIVLDMRTDPAQLKGLDADTLRSRIFDRSTPPEQRLFLSTVQINRCPMVAPIKTLNEADAERLGIDRALQLQRAATVASVLDSDLQSVIADALTHQGGSDQERMDAAIARCPEASLYSGGFLSDADRRLADKLANTPMDQLSDFAQANGFFDDERLQRLFMNYRARYAPNGLTDDERHAWQDDCIERLFEEDAMPWRTLGAFDELMANANWQSEHETLQQGLLSWRESVESFLEPSD